MQYTLGILMIQLLYKKYDIMLFKLPNKYKIQKTNETSTKANVFSIDIVSQIQTSNFKIYYATLTIIQ